MSPVWRRIVVVFAVAVGLWGLVLALGPMASYEDYLPPEKATESETPVVLAAEASPDEPVVEVPEELASEDLEIRAVEDPEAEEPRGMVPVSGSAAISSGDLGRTIADNARRARLRDLARPGAEPPRSVMEYEVRAMRVEPDQAVGPAVTVPVVVLPERPVTPEPSVSPPEVRFRLEAVRARYREGRYRVPLFVSAWVRRGGDWQPHRVADTRRLTLRDEARALEPRTLEMPAGEHFFAAGDVPLTPRESYELRLVPDRGEPSPVETVDWETRGPDLELVVRPEEQNPFATRNTPARFTVYLTDGGERIRPPAEATLDAAPSRGVTLEPVTLDEQGIWSAVAYAEDSLPEAKVDFSYLDLGLERTARVRFDYPRGQLALAVLMGLLGVIAVRGRSLLRMRRIHAGLELLLTAVVAFALYAAVVAGVFPFPWSPLSYATAALLGLAGGYMGKGVLDLLVRKLFPWIETGKRVDPAPAA